MNEINQEKFLNEQGMVEMINLLSRALRDAITSEITEDDNKIPNSEAVKNLINSRKKLKITSDTTVLDDESYTVEEQTETYNGNDEVQIHMHLASAQDIKNLFNNNE